MDHQTLQEQLFAFYDGELRGQAQRQVEAHLLDCAECRGLLTRWKQVAHSLQPAVPAVSEAFVARVMQRLSPAPRRAGRLSRWLAEGGWLVPAFGLAAIFFVLMQGPLQQAPLSVETLLLSESPASETVQDLLTGETASAEDVWRLLLEETS